MSEVSVTDRDGVRWIEIDRPSSKNGLTIEINAALIDAFDGVNADPSIRVAVLSGAGGSFSSGLDLKEAMRQGPSSPEQTSERMRAYFHGLIRSIRAVDAPTIAAVDGIAAGFGCDLALACDLRVLSSRARFGEIFVKRGLMPDGGGTFVLPRLIGLGRALELMFTGEVVDAEHALRIGLGNRVFDTSEFADRAWELARALAKGPPLAYRLMKRATYDSLSGDFEAALQRELEGQLQCLQSRDFGEGVAAFFAKREPEFNGS